MDRIKETSILEVETEQAIPPDYFESCAPFGLDFGEYYFVSYIKCVILFCKHHIQFRTFLICLLIGSSFIKLAYKSKKDVQAFKEVSGQNKPRES